MTISCGQLVRSVERSGSLLNLDAETVREGFRDLDARLSAVDGQDDVRKENDTGLSERAAKETQIAREVAEENQRRAGY
jgi:hypothetical protein